MSANNSTRRMFLTCGVCLYFFWLLAWRESKHELREIEEMVSKSEVSRKHLNEETDMGFPMPEDVGNSGLRATNSPQHDEQKKDLQVGSIGSQQETQAGTQLEESQARIGLPESTSQQTAPKPLRKEARPGKIRYVDNLDNEKQPLSHQTDPTGSIRLESKSTTSEQSATSQIGENSGTIPERKYMSTQTEITTEPSSPANSIQQGKTVENPSGLPVTNQVAVQKEVAPSADETQKETSVSQQQVTNRNDVKTQISLSESTSQLATGPTKERAETQGVQAKPKPLPRKRRMDCGCPETCDAVALSRQNDFFVCKKRVAFLMKKYEMPENKACSAAAIGPSDNPNDAPCGVECNPTYCSGTKDPTLTVQEGKNETNKPDAPSSVQEGGKETNKPDAPSSVQEEKNETNNPDAPSPVKEEKNETHQLCTREEIRDGEWERRISTQTDNLSVRWSWRTHASCNFTQWDPNQFCLAAAKQTIVFVGDSIALEHFDSLTRLYGSGRVPQSQLVPEGTNLFRWACGRNVPMFYRRDDNLYDLKRIINATNPSILILNRGAHYASDQNLTMAIQQNIRDLTEWKRNCPSCQLFWRTTTPGHPGCWNFTEPCNNITEMEALVNNQSLYAHFNEGYKFRWWDLKRQNKVALGLFEHSNLTMNVMDAYEIGIRRPDEHAIGPLRDCLLSRDSLSKNMVYNQILLHYMRQNGRRTLG